MEKYLTPLLKEAYMEDFRKVVSETREAWKLDAGIENILIEINKNSAIQTLYSKNNKSGLAEANESYLKFCYSSEIELKLLRAVIPVIIIKHNNIGKGSKCYYLFSPPKSNANYLEQKTPYGLGCLDDDNYFNINHIALYLESYNSNIHTSFWDELSSQLSKLRP